MMHISRDGLQPPAAFVWLVIAEPIPALRKAYDKSLRHDAR
jgi:hypothetical protein